MICSFCGKETTDNLSDKEFFQDKIKSLILKHKNSLYKKDEQISNLEKEIAELKLKLEDHEYQQPY
jgi:hypothetical protein